MIFFLSEDMQSIILYLNWLCWRISSMSFKKSHLFSVFLCSFFWALSFIIFLRLWKSTWLWIICVSINNIFLFFWWIFWATFYSSIAQSSFFYKTVSLMSFLTDTHLELYSSVDDSDFCDFQAVSLTFFTMILICFITFF